VHQCYTAAGWRLAAGGALTSTLVLVLVLVLLVLVPVPAVVVVVMELVGL
jgi:hypothetical protein